MNTLHIDRPRASLGGLDADALRVLVISAPLGSWDGLERLGSLRTLEIAEGASIPPAAVESVGRLSELRNLAIDVGDDASGVQALAGLKALERLRLDARAGGVPDCRWLGELVELEQLLISINSPDLVQIPLVRLRS